MGWPTVGDRWVRAMRAWLEDVDGEVLARPRPSLVLPRVIGHRGAAGVAPENTLAAIRAAKVAGAGWVEFDVKLTRDQRPILKHDERLERTTSGFGLVAHATLDEISRLCAGSWFHPEFAGERVPTLEEALALCAELGLGVNLEIKPCGGREAATARVAVETLIRHWPGHLPTPLISSFQPAALAVAREVAPEIPRGYLSHNLPRSWRAIMAAHDCATLHLNHRRVSRRQIERLVATGVPLLLFTVNDPGRAQKLLALGAQTMITDRVGEVISTID
jgi:glycerophosphoryl diester phosphodiesterase